MNKILTSLAAFPFYVVGILPSCALLGASVAFIAWAGWDNLGLELLLTIAGISAALMWVLGVLSYVVIVRIHYGLDVLGGHSSSTGRAARASSGDWKSDWLNSDSSATETTYVNPATGLLMVGGLSGLDGEGNGFGQNWRKDSDDQMQAIFEDSLGSGSDFGTSSMDT